MKPAILLAILTLTMNIAYANDESAEAGNTSAMYCEEQAQLAGIEDTDEKLEYIQDCIASFTAQSEISPEDNQE